jgi:flagellar hook-associated protein 1 FlgK
MSMQSLLSIARSALLVHQRAMDVTGHNIANASTPGYTRQRLELSAATPQWGALYPIGRGVTADALTRTRDRFFDASYREESGSLGLAKSLKDYLGRVEATMGEPSDSGIAAGLDGFFRSLSDLANDPANRIARDQVRQTATRLAQQVRSLDGTLGRIAQDGLADFRSQVGAVNSLAQQIAQLNGQIQATGGPAHTSSDLMDERDRLLDQLASYGDVRVMDRGDGSVGVMLGDTLLVDGGSVQALEVVTVGAGYGVGVTGGGAVRLAGGSLAGLADLTQNWLPNAEAQLDQLAQALVTEVNAIHRNGYTLAGTTGVDFFDPAGTSAGNLQLSAAVLASSDNIAAAGTNASGDGAIAQQLAGLSQRGLASLGGKSLREHWIGMAGWVGSGVESATRDESAAMTLVDRSDELRTSVSGVSVDEEMVALLGQQQAYTAAARLVQVASDMMDEVLRLL